MKYFMTQAAKATAASPTVMSETSSPSNMLLSGDAL